jgi:GDP-D-mannose dehydratase
LASSDTTQPESVLSERPLHFNARTSSLGDPTKAAQVLEWQSTIKFPDIVARMVRADREGVDRV